MHIVVKVGGSLEPYKVKLTKLMHTLAELAKEHNLIVVPGGGSFADKVREVALTYCVNDLTAHRMAILAMDQYGLFLSSFVRQCIYTYSLAEAKTLASKGVLCIYLPSREMLFDESLEPSWSVTSDSIAAYIAARCGCRFLILLKDVDGVFTDNPKKIAGVSLIREVRASELSGYGCVDSNLTNYIKRFDLVCWVLNGLKHWRFKTLLSKGKAAGTRISP
ncbi:MAG: hypothetical protein ACK4TI_01620 [Nitrososphaerales archaeon]